MLFRGFLLQLNPIYSLPFLENFAEIANNSRNDDLFVLFLLILSSSDVKASQKILSVIFNSVIFNGSITIFQKNSNQAVIILRNVIIEFLFRMHFDDLGTILKNFVTSPLVFVEVIIRAEHRFEQNKLQRFLTEEIVTLIVHVSLILWHFYKQNPEDQLIQSVQFARSSLFNFFFRVLQDPVIRTTCFSSFPFVGGFLTRALESSLCSSILSSFSAFLISSEGSNLDPSIRVISGLFEVSRASVHSKESHVHQLGIRLIILLNEAVILNPMIANPLQRVVQSLTTFLNSDPSQELLRQVLDMISRLYITSDTFQLSYWQIHEISSAVRRIEPNNLSDETMSLFLGLISLSKSFSIAQIPMFIIKRPSLIILLFSLIRTREKLEFLLDYFGRLCRISMFNCVQCHKGELDLLLLEMMSRNSFTFRGCEFDGIMDNSLAVSTALPLFRSISLVRSSPRVATRLLLMLSPLEDRSFPDIAPLILPYLAQFQSVFSLCQVPAIPLKISSGPICLIDDISSTVLEKEFTIQLWVKFVSFFSNAKRENRIVNNL
jgi:hypothetical protein